eukprot:TRINITY_DN1905_c0_g1_i7.p1 TRINITY_DN1905_c0_g1~~TRINITY_DN1905_c0_g1_i7.p1  ORF type:complete len:482 (+),score=61.79 TRINITY_DN1905_c0_g1_i7:856-2301(+)
MHIVDQVLLPFKKGDQSSLFAAIKNSNRLSKLADVITAAGLEETLSDQYLQYTIFAPNNYAFEQIFQGDLSVEDLAMVGDNILKDMLNYHIIPEGKYLREDLSDQKMLRTLIEGEKIQVVLNENSTAVKGMSNRANIVEFDIYGGRGIIHIIDSVLDYVPGRESSEQTQTEQSEIPQSASDKNEENLEVIDIQDLGLSVSLMLIEGDDNSSEPQPQPQPQPQSQPSPQPIPSPISAEEETEIIKTAIDTIIRAIEISGVDVQLTGEQSYTIFAPTEAAFQDLLASYKSPNLESMSRTMLRDIILQHVVVGKYTLEQLTNDLTLEALQDPSLSVEVNNSTVIIKSIGSRANVIIPELPIETSVVHIIDEVLVPFVPVVPVVPGTCSDVPPDFRFDCPSQLEFGKCNEEWMVEANYCENTCGRCSSLKVNQVASCDENLVQRVTEIVSSVLSEEDNKSCRENELEGVLLEMIGEVLGRFESAN